MRYRLRTLLIVLALGPVVIWGGWLAYEAAVSHLIRALIGPIEIEPVPPKIPIGSPAETRGPHVLPPEVRAAKSGQHSEPN